MHLRPYPDGIDYVWLASDMNGNVAAFVTGGSGPVPLSVLYESSTPIENVEEAVCELPEVPEALLLAELKRPNDFLDLARRGFLVYDWTDVHRIERDCTRAYELVAVPVQPVTVDTQPEAIRRLVADNRFAELTFGEFSSLDVSAVLV